MRYVIGRARKHIRSYKSERVRCSKLVDAYRNRVFINSDVLFKHRRDNERKMSHTKSAYLLTAKARYKRDRGHPIGMLVSVIVVYFGIIARSERDLALMHGDRSVFLDKYSEVCADVYRAVHKNHHRQSVGLVDLRITALKAVICILVPLGLGERSVISVKVENSCKRMIFSVIRKLEARNTRRDLVGVDLDSTRTEHYRINVGNVLFRIALIRAIEDLEVKRVFNSPLSHHLDLGVIHHNKLVTLEQTARG